MYRATGIVTAILVATAALAAPVDVPLLNPSFEGDLDQNGVPEGWRPYGGGVTLFSLVEGAADGARALLIDDPDPAGEGGLMQDFPVQAGENVRVRVSVRAVQQGSSSGAYLQLRFLPGQQYQQKGLTAASPEAYNEVEIFDTAPEGTTTARIYLYTHAEPMPKVMVDNVIVQTGVEPPRFPNGPAPDPIPPQYDTLKELYLQTALVEGGEPRAAIVTGRDGRFAAEAQAIQAAIEAVTGAELPIVADADTLPRFDRNLIVLGARESSATMRALYEGFFTLLDAKYPGPGGHEVRTVHNPYGDGRNVILVGGSEDEGVADAAQALIAMLRDAGGAQGTLAVGPLREVTLSDRYVVPRDPSAMQIWEASGRYGSTGYFGWNMISKHMAAYYVTGDEFHAREVLRLSFPDAETIAEIERVDGERIENKHDPLAGPYHYAAHMMILFWDLIEEDPFFTDEQRLQITNALSRQLTHRRGEGVYGRATPSASVGNRHGDWSAMSLYALARYFNRDYPGPIWDAAEASAHIYFDGIENSAWLAGNNDHLFWYTSYYDPLLDYMHLTGDRGGMENLRQALLTQDVLFIGEENDWGLNSSSLNFLHRAADITGDGRFVFYRDRTGLDLDVFRLGQSWWPEMEARPPTELMNAWTLQPMPQPMWRARASGIPQEQQFLWGTWRTTLDGGGDLMMIKGHNGGGRLPYHTFSVMEQRLMGATLLKGYRTQVITSADGMVAPEVAMDAGLLDHGVLGDTAWAIGEVPKMAFANWRRSVVQREGRYALFVDDLTFATDSDNMKVETEWQTIGGSWDAAGNRIRIQGGEEEVPEGMVTFSALEADMRCGPGTAEELLSDLTSIDTVLLKARETGVWMEMPFALEAPITGRVFADLLDHTDRGIISVALDGEVLVERYDHRAAATVRAQVDLGEHTLQAGEHTLRIEVIGGHPELAQMHVGLMGVSILPEGVELPARPLGFELYPSRATKATGSGTVVMQWLGEAREGEHQRFFHLLLPRLSQGDALGCYRIAENAAVLALPEPALAVNGDFEDIAAEVALLAEDHAVALGMTRLPWASATAPVSLRWEFATGTVIVQAAQATELTIAGEQHALEPGTHTLTVARADDAAWGGRLGAWLEQARAERERELAAAGEPATLEAPEMAASAEAAIGGKPVASEVIAQEEGDLLALAEGQTVHLLAADGSEVRALQADGPVRVLRWWPEEELLLVGCTDEQVIAFGLAGERRWVFVSEMDPAVWESGKTYWFKSAYPGIHGLHTGVVSGEESLAFVGSACTLEAVNADGQLVKRLPIFWGNCWKFQIVDRADGGRNLLIAQWANGTDNISIVNGDTLTETGKGYYGVPAGHTMVGGWTQQNRTGLAYADVNADGANELVSATNGIWNRLTVFSGSGTPLFNAQFGPGESAQPYSTMRDMAVADLDGDGDLEIVVAISEGLIVTLDHECRKVWATRLPSAPTRLEIVTAGAPAIIAGCEDGTIVRLSGSGEIAAQADSGGRVESLQTVRSPQGPLAVAATADGAVSIYPVE